ncbi:hypothetical protein F4774DRAFT_430302 [Daldinia eschscholtzii]|nr:hypothetical protein F4774DRAFT_430302 [Daldinia eschscholtzii]
MTTMEEKRRLWEVQSGLKCHACKGTFPIELLEASPCKHVYCASCVRSIHLTTFNHRQSEPYCCKMPMNTVKLRRFYEKELASQKDLFEQEQHAPSGSPLITCTKCIETNNITSNFMVRRWGLSKMDWRECRDKSGEIINYRDTMGTGYPRTCPCGARTCIECGEALKNDCNCTKLGKGWKAKSSPVMDILYISNK